MLVVLEVVVDVGDIVMGVRLGEDDEDGDRLTSIPFRRMMLLILPPSLFGEYGEESWESGVRGRLVPLPSWQSLSQHETIAFVQTGDMMVLVLLSGEGGIE